MNLRQLEAEREKAGAAYVKALEAFRDAWARLAAIDRTLANGNIASHLQLPGFHFRRFQMEEGLRSFQHHEFLPRILVNDWHDRAAAISDAQIEGFKP